MWSVTFYVFVGAFILCLQLHFEWQMENWSSNVTVSWRESWQKTAVCIYIILMENRCFNIMCVFKAWWNLLWLKLCSANIHVSVCQSFQTSFNLHGVTEPVFLQTALTTSMIKKNFSVLLFCYISNNHTCRQIVFKHPVHNNDSKTTALLHRPPLLIYFLN